MSFSIEYGNLFDHPAEALAHGVNCLGVAGAGIILEMKRRYPEAIRQYQQKALQGKLLPGTAMFSSALPERRFIIHCASQHRPGPDARVQWLQSSLVDGLQMLELHYIPRLALPLIGGGIGGLEPEVAEHTIRSVAELSRVEVTLVLPKARV